MNLILPVASHRMVLRHGTNTVHGADGPNPSQHPRDLLQHLKDFLQRYWVACPDSFMALRIVFYSLLFFFILCDLNGIRTTRLKGPTPGILPLNYETLRLPAHRTNHYFRSGSFPFSWYANDLSSCRDSNPGLQSESLTA